VSQCLHGRERPGTLRDSLRQALPSSEGVAPIGGSVSEVVVLTPTQLEAIVTRAVERVVANGGGKRRVWLDAGQLADYLGVSEKTVQNRTGPNVENPIPYHTLTLGGQKRFHREEVDEWLRRS
jgi:excisionase family DNA binding protein